MRSFLKDLAFVTVNLAVCACFGWLLYADFTTRLEKSGGVRLGTITYKKNIAERKYGDQILWEPCRSGPNSATTTRCARPAIPRPSSSWTTGRGSNWPRKP